MPKIYLTSGTSWAGIATDGEDIIIECIGAGGGGATPVSGDHVGVGGGGGAYATSIVPYVSGSAVSGIQIGQGGSASSDGTDTIWNTNVVIAKGGKGGNAITGVAGAGGAAASCTPPTGAFSGGTGGGIGADHISGAGGGGGAGPFGSGSNGGVGGADNFGSGAGGGGNGGGSTTAGGASSTGNGGSGGTAHDGTAGGGGGTGSATVPTAGSDGVNGSGGGGGGGTGPLGVDAKAGGSGGTGNEYDSSHGSGGGGGGGGSPGGGAALSTLGGHGGAGGLYGGGGGGGGWSNLHQGIGGTGGNGLIIISYTTGDPEAGDIIYRGTSEWKRLQGNRSVQRKFLSETGTGGASAFPEWDRIIESDFSFTDITTANVSTAKHGLTPKLSNNANTYLDGTGAYTVPGGGTSAGTVTNTGTLTNHALIVGDGGVDVSALGSLGSTTTVLHGNSAGAPTFGAVSLTADVSGDLPFANFVQATAASKLVGRGSASGAGDFEEVSLGTGLTMSGTTLSASGSGGTITETGALTANQLVIGAGTTVVSPLGTLGTTTTLLHGNAGGAPTFSQVDLAADVTGTLPTSALASNIKIAGLAFLIDGGGSTITTGVKGFVQMPFSCTITSWTILSTDASATSGSIVIDIWKDTYTNYPPTVADTITASAKPTMTTANHATSSTLTGWTTSVTAGDVLGFNVDSITTVTKIMIQLAVNKT